MKPLFALLATCWALSLVGCADGSDANVDPGHSTRPFQTLYDQGVDRYLGAFTPMVAEPAAGNAIRHRFGGADGPLCFTGNEFSMSTRDGDGRELMIFLQGGGACSPTSCQAVDVAWPVINAGILSAEDPANPAADMDLGYVPYCDGTLFTGDADVDSDGDGTADRFFRGIQNLSASLDVIANRYPTPDRILLAGNSAGGSGVHFALPLVRKLYPGVAIDLVNDSGVGILRPGAQDRLNDYWQSAAFFPADCATCIGADGNLTDYHAYQLAEDPDLRMGFISSTADEVIVGRAGLDPAVFEAELRTAVAELEAAHPARFRSLISETDEHTYLIRQFDFVIAGQTVRAWVTDMLGGTDDWVSASE